jgi:hypothetical protein
MSFFFQGLRAQQRRFLYTLQCALLRFLRGGCTALRFGGVALTLQFCFACNARTLFALAAFFFLARQALLLFSNATRFGLGSGDPASFCLARLTGFALPTFAFGGFHGQTLALGFFGRAFLLGGDPCSFSLFGEAFLLGCNPCTLGFFCDPALLGEHALPFRFFRCAALLGGDSLLLFPLALRTRVLRGLLGSVGGGSLFFQRGANHARRNEQIGITRGAALDEVRRL